MKSKKLPKEIFVHWDSSYDLEYLTASETLEDIEDDRVVGVYILKAVQKMRVTKKLE